MQSLIISFYLTDSFQLIRCFICSQFPVRNYLADMLFCRRRERKWSLEGVQSVYSLRQIRRPLMTTAEVSIFWQFWLGSGVGGGVLVMPEGDCFDLFSIVPVLPSCLAPSLQPLHLASPLPSSLPFCFINKNISLSFFFTGICSKQQSIFYSTRISCSYFLRKLLEQLMKPVGQWAVGCYEERCLLECLFRQRYYLRRISVRQACQQSEI